MAGTKYNSRQHRALFREFFLNGSLGIHEALILSAQHGFLSMGQMVEDYDLLLDDDRAAELATSQEQHQKLAKALDGHDEVYLYGGELYRDRGQGRSQDPGIHGLRGGCHRSQSWLL